MPLKRCTRNGKRGWKWGDAGKCYIGTGAKKRAIKQGVAIDGPKVVRRGAQNMGVKNKSKLAIEEVILNFTPSAKLVVENGVRYWVTPVVMLREGVHNGTKGPLFYPSEVLENEAEIWEDVPITVNHTPSNKRASELPDTHVGKVKNSRFEYPKLKAEAWLREDKLKASNGSILGAIMNGTSMEVSTGLVPKIEKKKGVWNTESYIGKLTSMGVPDHLALLPDKIGACSVADGCGLTMNQLSDDSTRSQLRSSLDERFGDKLVFLADTFSADGLVVFELIDKIEDTSMGLFKLNFSVSDNVVELSDDSPEEVVLVREYRTIDGEVLGNASDRSENMAGNEQKGPVDLLIENEESQWTEDDREFLEGLDEEKLTKIVGNSEEEEGENPTKNQKKKAKPSSKKATTQNKEACGKCSHEEEIENAAKRGAKGIEPKTSEQQTLDEYVNNAPPEIQDFLSDAMGSLQEQRDDLIETITNNEENEFSEDELNNMKTPQLRKLAKIAKKKEAEEGQESAPVANRATRFTGASGAPVKNNNHKETPLVPPVMTFDNKS